MKTFLLLVTSMIAHITAPTTAFVIVPQASSCSITQLEGWLDNFLPKPVDNYDDDRQRDFPEQYPATYDLLLAGATTTNDKSPDAKLIRPLLKQTMLQERDLQVVYDAQQHGWSPQAFHERVDTKGAAVVVAKVKGGELVGGYNPKGWSSNGGSRPSVAAFLFYATPEGFQKLQKVGGGGLACGRDDPEYGIAFGPDGLMIALSQSTGRQRLATSKLGPYYERGPDDLPSLFSGGGATLESLKVLVGVYGKGEEIPYSGAVMDMTSG